MERGELVSKDIKPGDKFISYLLDDDDEKTWGVYTCISNVGPQYLPQDELSSDMRNDILEYLTKDITDDVRNIFNKMLEPKEKVFLQHTICSEEKMNDRHLSFDINTCYNIKIK